MLCNLSAGGKFDHDSYEKSAGLHGVGVSAVNAVSSNLAARVVRDGRQWVLKCAKGVVQGNGVEDRGPATGHGTTIRWRRDLEIFSNVTEYDRKIVENRLRELAFLNPGLTLTLEDARGDKPSAETFHYAGGLRDFLGESVSKRKGALPILYFTDQKNCEFAFTWADGQGENIRCYSNNTFNGDGGTHLTGFKNGLTRVITAYAKEHGMLEDLPGDGLTGGDIREGLIALVTVQLRDIAFSSQTKDKLVSPQGKAVVEDLFAEQVAYYLGENPGLAKKIAERAVVNAKAREAARKAREGVIRKHAFDSWELPGKLSDCQSRKPSECELILVEGDSAGGTARMGRDRRFQAVLPLRGKVLNIERQDAEAIIENKEIATIIGALGCGIEQDRSFDISKLRYHTILIATDADTDGSHIATLLLTLFYRAMPKLLYNNHVKIARPPLYKVVQGKHISYFTDDAELEQYAAEHRQSRQGMRITRFKGLGEMNAEELWSTTLDPAHRKLKSVEVRDAIDAEFTFNLLMGDDVPARREWIENVGDWTHAVDV